MRGDPAYARVSPRFWTETQTAGWTPDMVTLGLYLLTNEHRTTEGIYRLPVQYMAADLPGDWSVVRVTASLDALVAQGFVMYDRKARVVFFPKALKYQRPDNPNQQVAAIKSVRALPPTHLTELLLEAADRYAQGFAQALRKAFPEGFPQGHSDPPAPTPAPTQRSNPMSSADALNGADTRVDESEFQHWWSTYGKVGRVADARPLYTHWRKKGATADELLSAAVAYRAHCQATDCKMLHARTFLSKTPNRWVEWTTGEDHGSMDAHGAGTLTDVLEAGALAFGLNGGRRGNGLGTKGRNERVVGSGADARRGLPSGELDSSE